MAKKSVKKATKKKTVKKKISKKKPVKKTSKNPRVKLNRYLLNSVILLAISIALYAASPLGLWSDVFYMAIIVFGSLSLAFVIVLLVKFFIKILRK